MNGWIGLDSEVESMSFLEVDFTYTKKSRMESQSENPSQTDV